MHIANEVFTRHPGTLIGAITERQMAGFFLALQRYIKAAFPQATVSPVEIIGAGGK